MFINLIGQQPPATYDYKKCLKSFSVNTILKVPIDCIGKWRMSSSQPKKDNRLFMKMHTTIVDLQFHFVCYLVATNITEGKLLEDNTFYGSTRENQFWHKT